MAEPLNAGHIARQLDRCLETEFTFTDTAPAAEAIAALPRREQEFVLDLVARVASTHLELGSRVANHATAALEVMDTRMVEAWALHAADTYDRVGLRPALQALEEIDRFEQLEYIHRSGALLEDAAGVLLHFLHGLSGRELAVKAGEAAYTDTETIYLPPALAVLPDSRDNFLLYKVSTAYLWAQVRFGTFRVPLSARLAEHPRPDRLVALFATAERLRLEACLARELPGLSRQMQRLAEIEGGNPPPVTWRPIAEALSRPLADAAESLRLVTEHFDRLEPHHRCYQGELRTREADACLAARAEKEKALFRYALKELLEEQQRPRAPSGSSSRVEAVRPEGEEGRSLEVEILIDDQPVAPPDQVRQLAGSIIQDFGGIPPEYLVPAGEGEYDPNEFLPQARDPDNVWQGTYHEEGAFFYNEWDHKRQHYRKDWCVVRELDVAPAEEAFGRLTLQKYAGLVRHLRKSFEAMRDEERLLNRQPDGDEIDLDALVEALADARNGAEMPDRVYSRLQRSERDIAVVFMVDMSGSTKGWINDAERESLVLLAEALQALGDRFAIYGFSGMTRKRCEIYKVKGFEQPYDTTVQARIGGIEAKDYTRMGFAIRHLTRLLAETDARTRILVTLSDGKPDDYSDYRGEYGIEDTRRALLEARRAGIHPYCITIDQQGQEYLPHMYGPAAYTVVDEVRALPLKVADIYRRLTL